MNSSNVRDIIPQLLRRGVVVQVWVRKRKWPRYQLTPVGVLCRELLVRAESGR